jgi:hypothetical protein
MNYVVEREKKGGDERGIHTFYASFVKEVSKHNYEVESEREDDWIDQREANEVREKKF